MMQMPFCLKGELLMMYQVWDTQTHVLKRALALHSQPIVVCKRQSEGAP